MANVNLNTNFSPVSLQFPMREVRMTPRNTGLAVNPYLEATCGLRMAIVSHVLMEGDPSHSPVKPIPQDRILMPEPGRIA